MRRQFARWRGAVSKARIVFDSVTNVEEFRARLLEIPGIGEWKAQYIAMRVLGDPDAFPASDLGLLRGASLHHERELSQHAEAWRPWRAYAAMYLWQGTDDVCLKEPEERSSNKRPSARTRSVATAGYSRRVEDRISE